MKLLWQCMFSPRLYAIYGTGTAELLHQPKFMEKWCDRLIYSVHALMNIGIYTSPIICMYIYKRNFSYEESKFIARVLGSFGCFMALAFLLRGIGRATDPNYLMFLRALTAPRDDKRKYYQALRHYDFPLADWPVNYALAPLRPSPWPPAQDSCANGHLPQPQRFFIQVLAYLATHTFALRLVYPGALSLVHYLVWGQLAQGRALLVEQFDGERAKIRTGDGNDIDTMFVDNRQYGSKGAILVICSEGNSGFYEMGIMTTPAKAGYSALGWNHPGFAESTGRPYPEQEHNAIDAIMQYALTQLGFKAQHVVLFGWSIGAYAVSWAAVNYPVQGLILDATFDDLLPLAENQMPKSWAPLVREVIRNYINLDIADLVTQYKGPVQFIRRTDDEIICLKQGLLSSNRGNHLVLRVMEARHPDLAGTGDDDSPPLEKYIALLATQRALLTRTDISDSERRKIRLIGLYQRDFNATHCAPLPERVFEAAMDNIVFKEK